MKKICKLIAVAIFKVDTALYKTFGFVSSFRKQSWARRSEKLQRALDREHFQRDSVNTAFKKDYTTKRALEVFREVWG